MPQVFTVLDGTQLGQFAVCWQFFFHSLGNIPSASRSNYAPGAVSLGCSCTSWRREISAGYHSELGHRKSSLT